MKPPAYGASKAAVLNLTKYLAAFWGPRGVRVNALSPGGVLGGQDEEFNRKLLRQDPAAPDGRGRRSRRAAGVPGVGRLAYVTGINLQVDGGITVW